MLRLATLLLASVTMGCLAETLVTIDNDLMGKLTGEKGEVSFVFVQHLCKYFFWSILECHLALAKEVPLFGIFVVTCTKIITS